MTGRAATHLAMVCALMGASCQAPESRAGALPPGPHVVDVEMSEYRFDYDSAVPAGRSLFRVRNTGTVPHSLSVLPLTDDVPPIEQQLRGSRRLGIVPFAGVGALDPGESTTFAVDLAQGVRYAFVCFMADPKGQPHALLGMASEVRTAGGRRANAGPSSTAPSAPLDPSPVTGAPPP